MKFNSFNFSFFLFFYLLTFVSVNGIKFTSTEEFEKEVFDNKFVWVLAVVDTQLSSSRHFETALVPQLSKRLESYAKVGVIEVQDLPVDFQKPSLQDLSKATPLLWLVHRSTRTVKEVIIPMEPDGHLHAQSVVPAIRNLLDRNKVSGNQKLKLGVRDEL
mmetsp:Transcript_9533/g.12943  ORF Transcript_9533/g.12943 Transcript_9533/m.12943 type:complete len:160 (-) Transcript_9533:279-758(-)|eukprot:CAMPEP_0196579166 /NCGR_PEP_ID=MMETSP1081-20130531/17982_1 /TAXON_ID=36882 /ORGANISM="Pyramimonas amylifera, Strain CCMP720" /LENGTH=159 /DNA_ID=CAMNT_0041898641 /DNA_START=72 /DNA_END=551 /DNA_ORIENTATION=+